MNPETLGDATNGPPAGRCAYVVSRYPSVSHTFVMREVAALRERGVEVDTVTVRRTEREDVIGTVARGEDATTYAILPTTPWRLARANLRAVGRSPRAYLATLVEALRDSSGGVRATLWQLFYFAEAMLLKQHLDERDLRHVHAHHANVAADVAMIATRYSNRVRTGAATWSFTFHGPTELGDPAGHKLGLKVARADAVVAISDYARARLLELAPGLDGDRIRVIRCGVDPGDYAAHETSPAGSKPLRLLTVAMLQPRKGIETLLAALARLRGRRRRG